jgi:hypothetical protein
MLTIDCIPDLEEGPDAIDPLGTLRISDGQSAIVVKTTYLDSWLAALIEAVDRARSVDHFAVEISEEPSGLHLDRTPNGTVFISRDGNKVIAENWLALERSVRTAASAFLKTVGGWPSAGKNEFLKPIRRFVGITPN